MKKHEETQERWQMSEVEYKSADNWKQATSRNTDGEDRYGAARLRKHKNLHVDRLLLNY